MEAPTRTDESTNPPGIAGSVESLPSLQKYLISFCVLLVVFSGRWMLDSILQSRGPLYPFLIAVAFGAWYGGIGCASLMAFVGFVLNNIFFNTPLYQFSFLFPEDLVLAALYFSESAIIIALTAKLKFNQRLVALHNTELSALNQQTRDIIDSIGDSIIAVDHQWRFTYVNRMAEEYSRMKSENMLGRCLWDVLPHLRGTALERVCQEVAKDGKPQRIEFQGIISPRSFEISIFPARDGLSIYTRDVSLRKQIEDERFASQNALLESDRLLRFAQECANAGTWEWELDTGKLTWSDQCYALHGIDRSQGEINFERWLTYISDSERERALKIVAESIKDKQEFRIEFLFQHPSKGPRWLSSIGRTLYDENDRPLRMGGISTDITVHKLAEEHKARLSAIVDSSSDAIIMEALDGTILSWNDGAAKMFEYQADEVIGQHVSKLASADRLEELVKINEAVRSRQGVHQLEMQYQRKKGAPLWVSLSISTVYDTNGHMIGVSKIARDITDRKKAEQQQMFLIEATEVLSSSLDYQTTLRNLTRVSVPTLADGCALDMLIDGKLSRLAMFHRDPDMEILTNLVQELYPPHPDDIQGLYQVIRSGEPELYSVISDESIRQFTPDKRRRDILLRLHLRSVVIVPIKSHEKIFGTITLMSSSAQRIYQEKDLGFALELGRRAALAIENARLYSDAQDALSKYQKELTERKKTEVALLKAKDAADAANEAKSAFLANMSHEIRTPLGAILGFSELLMTAQQDSGERRNFVDIIKRNGQLLSNLIDDILDLSKVEAGKLSVKLEAVPLPKLLDEVKNSLNLQAAEKGIQLFFRNLTPLPQLILTDSIRLKQIFNNVIGNAIKFTERGAVTVSIQTAAGPSELLQIDVNDTGLGIAPEYISKLFEPFNQADPTYTRKHGGTGLGLALSRKLARLLGGDLVLMSSEYGIGSRFVITINPQVASLRGEYRVAAKPERAPLPPVDFEKILHHLKVLVVDDSPDNRVLLAQMLNNAGATVDMAADGRQGLDRARANAYDVILMDVQMPIMDGFEATRELRKGGFANPIIALTAHAMKEEKDRCLDVGFNDHLSKPINWPGLIDRLAHYKHN